MSFLSKKSWLISIFAFLISSYATAQSLKPIGKKYFKEEAFKFHLSDELYKAIDETNNIFKETDVSFSFRFNDFVDFTTKWSRNVHDRHQNITNTINSNDLSKFLTVNSIYSKLKAGIKYGPISIGPDTEYGVMFSVGKVSNKHQVNPSLNINSNTVSILKSDISEIMLNNECFACSDKKTYVGKVFEILRNIYLSSLEQAENVIQWILNPFMEDDDAEEYNREPLAALKQHALFGLPVDSDVFLEDDPRLNPGDIIKHTSFATFQPITLGAGLNNALESESSIFLRLIEEVTVKKLAENKAKVQIRFVKSYGGNITFSRLHTNLLIGPKYTFLDWQKETSDQVHRSYTFTYDLNESEAKKHLQELFNNNYIVSFIDVNSDTIEIELPRGVVFEDALRKRAEKNDKSYYSSLPRLSKTLYQNINNVTKDKYFTNNNQELRRYSAENLLTQERSNKGIKYIFKDRDKVFRTHILAENSPGYNYVLDESDDSFVLNFTNYIKNVRADKEFLDDIVSMDYKLLKGFFNRDDYQKLKPIYDSIANTTAEVLYQNQISFNRSHLIRVLQHSPEDILRIAAGMFLGEENTREWVENAEQWDLASSDFFSKQSQKLSLKYDCISNWPSELNKNLIRNRLRVRSCLKLYKWTKQFIRDIQIANSSELIIDRVNYLISSFNRLELSPGIQLLLAKMAGGYGDSEENSGVRFESNFFTPELVVPVSHTNGASFELPYGDRYNAIEDIEARKHSSDRVRQAVFYTEDTTSISDSKLFIEINSIPKFKNSENHPMYLQISFKKKGLINNDSVVNNYVKRLNQPTVIKPIGAKSFHRYLLQLPAPTGFTGWFRELLEPGKQYHAFVSVINSRGQQLTEKSKFTVKIPKN